MDEVEVDEVEVDEIEVDEVEVEGSSQQLLWQHAPQ